MTALKKFSRLEAKAVWIENSDKSPKQVILSFGKSSIIISDENGFPIDHWNFNSIIIISESKDETIFSQESNKIEKLIIKDDEMIKAIVLICNSEYKPTRYVLRTTKIFRSIVFLMFISIFFYFPNILRQMVFEVTEPRYEAIFYENVLNKLINTSEICNKNNKIEAYEKKINTYFTKDNFLDIIVLKYGEDKPMLLPGGKVIIPFNWLKNEKFSNNFQKMIQVAIYGYKERLIFKKLLKEQNFTTLLSFIFGIDKSFDLNFDDYLWTNFIISKKNNLNILLTEEEWINFRNICYN